MDGNTRWIVGTGIGTAVTVLTVGIALGGLMVSQHAGINARLDALDADVRELRAEVRALDDRLRSVEIAFGKVDQRLETLERAILPAAAPAG